MHPSQSLAVVFPLHFEKDAGKKAALKEKMKTETFPKFLTQVGKVTDTKSIIL